MCRLIFNRSQVLAGGMTLKRTKRAFVLFAKKKPKKEKEHKKGKGHKKDKSKKSKKAKKDKVMSIILYASNLSALHFYAYLFWRLILCTSIKEEKSLGPT